MGKDHRRSNAGSGGCQVNRIATLASEIETSLLLLVEAEVEAIALVAR